MKTPEGNMSELTPKPEISEELTSEVIKNETTDSTVQKEGEPISLEDELTRLEEAYQHLLERGKYLIREDLRSAEFVMLSHQNEVQSDLFKKVHYAYIKLGDKYLKTYGEHYETQLNIETGEKDYTDELLNKYKGAPKTEKVDEEDEMGVAA